MNEQPKQKNKKDLPTAEMIKHGPPIAQFLDAKLLCPKCKLIVANMILITQSSCCVNYFRRLVQMSAAETLLIAFAQPRKEGNPAIGRNSSVDRVNTSSCTTGYDLCSGKFMQIRRRLDFSGMPFKMVKVSNSPVGFW